MRPTLSFQVKPRLPQPLTPLARLSMNLWFTWNPEAVELFQRIDNRLWSRVHHNPVELLNRVSQERLDTLAADSGFLAQMERVAENMRTYLEARGCPFLGRRIPEDFRVAYFSAEFGLADCLPIYSGGLGVLAGDHLKSASNLNLPLVGIGLAYRQGYFTQYLNPDGWQQETYRPNDFWSLPMTPVRDQQGREITISVDIAGQPLKARAWLVRVGRVPLYLLDSNLPENPPELRSITHRLYGGDRTMRIRQEILLGIGGVRLLEALDIPVNVVHMNEGHSAFASLERIRQLRHRHGLSFDEAREVVKASNCFTTHTPVPAGNDYFEPGLVKSHFQDYVQELGISLPVLLGYGRLHPGDQEEHFCMTVLALRLSGFANGVSRLHGRVSRAMWKEVWPHFPQEDVPITHITNGVHIPSWISNDMAYLYYRYLGPAWMEDPDSQAVWANVENIPDGELWRVHERRRARMIAFVRRRLARQLQRRGVGGVALKQAAEVLNTEALTIVFARRFATYKRAVLILRDRDRLARLLGDHQRPVQLVFAGKAHPRDHEGKEFIRQVVQVADDERLAKQVVFLEDYDINVARYLVQGADVWLNTPRRPLEACGTSGMKAAANGALNLSIRDGWWDEGFEPGLGWAIGAGEEYPEQEEQDQVEAQALYRLLEREVVPLFYQRGPDGLPRGWIDCMKKSLRRLCPVFNTHRMLEDYAEAAYLPAAGHFNQLCRDDFALARELGAWVKKIMENWDQVEVVKVASPAAGPLTWGQVVEVEAKVRLGGLEPGDVACDLYHGPLDAADGFREAQTQPMQPAGRQGDLHLFKGQVTCRHTGRLGIKVRLVPYHPALSSKYALGLAAWG